MFLLAELTQAACAADHHPHDCGAIDRSPGKTGAVIIFARIAIYVSCRVCRPHRSRGMWKGPAQRRSALSIGDLLFRGGNGVGTGDEAARRSLLARNGGERSRKLGRITVLQAILGFQNSSCFARRSS